MIDLRYSLIIEATEDPAFFAFILPIWTLLNKIFRPRFKSDTQGK
jgi:hypothetical protein